MSGVGDPGPTTSSNNATADAVAAGIGVAAPTSQSQALSLDEPQGFAVQGVYFKREWFRTQADCLTAASARHLPLNICE